MQAPSTKPQQSIEGSTDRTFGLVFATLFMILALLPLLHGNSVRLWALAASVAILALAVFAARLLRPFNRLWTQFGLLLHRLVGPVALAILFLFVVTPTGLLMRLFRKDPLRLRRDPSASTYWILRTPPGPSADSLRNQF